MGKNTAMPREHLADVPHRVDLGTSTRRQLFHSSSSGGPGLFSQLCTANILGPAAKGSADADAATSRHQKVYRTASH
jgi:hypothetical protein